jgi:hypothetical protein
MSCVDVIVPCYKYAHYLHQCVESVLAQSHGDFRVLIIDDCSPDNTEEVAQELVARDGRVAYRRHESNCGHIATYNEGLEWAEKDYVLLLSADDFLTAGALERAVKLLDAHPQVALSYGRQILFHADQAVPSVHPQGEFSWQIVAGSEFIEQCCISGHNPVATPTVVVRNSFQRKVGGYRRDLPHTADLELWLRLAVVGAVCRIEEDQACKRMHATNIQHQFLETALGDLQQRQAAFSFLFREHVTCIADAERLEGITARSLGAAGFWAASEAFDRGELALCQRLLDFAVATDPELRSRSEWARFAFKRGLGPRFWRMIRPTVDFFRGRYRAALVFAGI